MKHDSLEGVKRKLVHPSERMKNSYHFWGFEATHLRAINPLLH